MRVISVRPLRKFWERRPDAQSPLRHWYRTVKRSDWRNFVELRGEFPHADQVTINGKQVIIFNVGGNNYRLLAVVEYKWRVVYVRAVMTHAEYDNGRWKRLI